MLSIDTTAVLLAPIGLAMASELGLSALPFAFAAIWLANSASLLLPVSNLTNLLAQSRIGTRRRRLRPRDLAAPARGARGRAGACCCVRHRTALRGSYEVPRALPAYDRGAAADGRGGRRADRAGDRRSALPAWLVALVAAVVLVVAFAVRRPDAVRPRRLAGWSRGRCSIFAIVLFALVEVVVEEGSTVLDRALRHRRARWATWPSSPG